jgi:hypothetical protein
MRLVSRSRGLRPARHAAVSDRLDTAGAFETIAIERRGGVLQLRFHTDGGPL